MADDYLRDLIERSSQVAEMTRHPGWELLQDFVREKLHKEQEWLILGHADTIEEYRQKVGFVEGVLYVFGAPERLEKQVEIERQKERQS